MREFQRVYLAHKVEAEKAYALFLDHYPDAPRVPGMDTVCRLAWRIAHGKTAEQSAAREYVYRWGLAIKPFDQCEGNTRNPACSIFGAPHTIGL